MISIITPTNNPQWLTKAQDSLKAQTYQGDFEWLIVPNGDTNVLPETVANWAATRIVPYTGASRIGAIKRFCCERAKGDIVVELDHDDMLTPFALEKIANTFEDASIDFAYSNFAEFKDGNYEPNTYNPDYGWKFRKRRYYEREFTETRAFEPSAASLSLVHYAPNHVRAWRSKAYFDVGGHDGALEVCDDHDLCCRFYLHKQMKHIDDCLYLYRIHGDNSYLKHNAKIQTKTQEIRGKYLWKLAERWADLNGLPKLDLGAAHGKPAGYVGVDVEPGPGVDRVCDLSEGIPADDSKIGVVRAMDFLEHVADSVGLMNEIWRVLVDGGWLISGTPSTDGRGAFQDPTHVAFWNENSFWYYTNRFYAAYVPTVACRFQAHRVVTSYPSEFHRQRDIPYVYADLTAVKTWKRRPGLIEC